MEHSKATKTSEPFDYLLDGANDASNHSMVESAIARGAVDVRQIGTVTAAEIEAARREIRRKRISQP